MDKRSEGTKPSAPTEGGKRRQGLADKDTVKGKKTRSHSEDLSVAPVEEQAKTKCANTYRLESRNKFRDCLVRDKAQEILTSKLQQAKYDGVSSPSLCASISEEILKAVKKFGFERYKYVVSVLIVEKTDQAMIVYVYSSHQFREFTFENNFVKKAESPVKGHKTGLSWRWRSGGRDLLVLLPADASGMFKETLGFQLNVKLKHLLRWLW